MPGEHPQAQPPPNTPSTESTQSCTIQIVPRTVKTHSISETELDAIAAGSPATNLTFFGICLGAAVSFGIVVRTITLDPDNKSFFSVLLYASLLFAAYFGVCAAKDSARYRSKLREIKSGSAVK